MLSTRRRRALLTVIVATGAALRFWSVRFGLPHDLARPDEEKIVNAALGILGGDLNPHFFLYPSLFIYVTAGAYELASLLRHVAGTTALAAGLVTPNAVDNSSLHLTARVVSAITGVATIGALYAAARELFNDRVALIGAALLAVTFLHVRDSHFGVTDVPVTLLVVLAFWAAARCVTRGVTLRRVALAGVLCGLAASTKYNAGLVVVPAVAAIAARIDWRERLSATRAASAIAVLCAAMGLGFMIGTPFAVLDRSAFMSDVDAQRQTALGRRHGTVLDPAREVMDEPGWLHHLRVSLRYGAGLPLLGLALAGGCWLLAARRRDAIVVLAFPVLYFVAMGGDQLAYARYMVPLVPFLCLAAGVLTDRAAELARAVSRYRFAPVLTTIAILCVAGAPTLAQSIAFDRLMARPDTRLSGATWIEAEFPEGATVYQTGMVYGQLQPRPAERYPECRFDDRLGRFTGPCRVPSAPPDVVVVLDSPLTIFNRTPSRLPEALQADYDLAVSFTGIDSEAGRRAIYDQQDAFYAPLDGFAGIARPGPGVRIFLRRVPAVRLTSTTLCGLNRC
jgi:hypothetical protein